VAVAQRSDPLGGGGLGARLLADLQLILGGPNGPALEQALAQVGSGNDPAAAQSVEQVLSRSAGDPDALHMAALLLARAGRTVPALRLVMLAVAGRPDEPGLLANAGRLCRAAGRSADAVTFYRRALDLSPDRPAVLNNLGALLREQGEPLESEGHLRRAVTLLPDYGEAWSNLGNCLRDLGRLDAAREALEIARHLLPDVPEVAKNLGLVHLRAGRWQDALPLMREAAAWRSEDPEAWVGLGHALRVGGDNAGCIDPYRRALALKPDMAGVHQRLGIALRQLGDWSEALGHLREADRLAPNRADILVDLGTAEETAGSLFRAEDCFRRALELVPDFPPAWANLAGTLSRRGAMRLAIPALKKACEVAPEDRRIHTNLIFTLYFDDAIGFDELMDEHHRWNRKFGDKQPIGPHRNDPDPEQRLRIGYVCADFNHHSNAFAFGPLIEFADREQFSIHAYSGALSQDGVTDRFRSMVDGFLPVNGLDDAQLAHRIQNDGIDILVDLAGHTRGNRLPMFAHKPAPVQVAWINVTGLQAIDWLLTDRAMWPEPIANRSPERKWYLDCGALPFRPPQRAPRIGPGPGLRGGPPTFGCFNNPLKLNDRVLDCWSRLLKSIPGSRFVMKYGSLKDPAVCDDFRERFVRRGIDADRLSFLGETGRRAHMEAYREMDVALDPFPGNGGVTTWEALWMGVPVVALSGDRPNGRGSQSILTAIGLEDMVAEDLDGYARIAANLISDRPRLKALRSGLRERISSAPISTDYTRQVEVAYRAMWRDWCRRQTGEAVQ